MNIFGISTGSSGSFDLSVTYNWIKAALPEKSEGYIQVFLDGGLNQQRMGVGIWSLLVRSKVSSCVCVKNDV